MKHEHNILCFSSDTMILTNRGEKPISKIKTTDVIIAYDHDINNIDEIRVERIANSFHNTIAKIFFANDKSIKCTLDHPIWVLGKGWSSLEPSSSLQNYHVHVSNLLVGDKCMFNNGGICSYVEVNNIEYTTGNFIMYATAGMKYNCFFANGFLVHDENLLKLDLRKDNINHLRTQKCAVPGSFII